VDRTVASTVDSNDTSNAELSLLYGVARTLLAESDYGNLLARLLDATIDGFGADRGFVVVREGTAFHATVSRNFKSEALSAAEEDVSHSISRAVVEGGRALLIDDALDSERFRDQPSVRRMALRSVLCAPLVASQEAFALIYLENRDIANRFTERHRQLLDEICALAAPRLRAAVVMEHARRRAAELESELGGTDGIITADKGMARLLESVRQVAPSDLPVLIQGETGTGKELVARALYRRSARASGAFVIVNCAALPATLIESELFGYLRGAFTGAQRDRVGLIGSAHRGTLFLDEIGEMPLELQPRLLRVLQSGELMRLGSVRPETVDVRVIAASNRVLEVEVEAGRFRRDLYYRLCGITLKIPPLRDRRHDIHLLAGHFLESYAARYAREAPRLTGNALAVLAAWSFPGNVRELESEMARLATVSPAGAELGPQALNDRIRGETCKPWVEIVPMSLEEMEKKVIVAVLETTGGNRKRAAEVLGISREGLRNKMLRLFPAEAENE
jgi:transcriptional regulator with GAF, ATPase, and Fis domain